LIWERNEYKDTLDLLQYFRYIFGIQSELAGYAGNIIAAIESIFYKDPVFPANLMFLNFYLDYSGGGKYYAS